MNKSGEYSYNRFLNDSSDEPSFPCDIEDKTLFASFKEGKSIKQSDDDMIYQEAYKTSKASPEFINALKNTLILAGERMEQLYSPDYSDGEIEIADESLRMIKRFINKIEEKNN
mgnify:CR=1 FL=1